MRDYLVVANQTLVSESVTRTVCDLMRADPSRFHIVVPATAQQQRGLTWTRGEALAVAGRHLEHALSRLSAVGAEVTGEVGDERPVLAVLDVLRRRSFDEVLLCTLPPGASRWLRQDLPRRLQRRAGLPLRHYVVLADADRGVAIVSQRAVA